MPANHGDSNSSLIFYVECKSKKSVGKRICKRMNGELIENGALLHHIVEVLECPFYQGTNCRHERLAGFCQ